MLIDKLKYLQGYVKVKLYGYAPERFLNLCSNRNILIWNLEYEDGNYIFCISIKGLKSLKPILKKTRTTFVILERYGMPFYLHRYRKRKLFAVGILVCSLLLYTMSLFVWKIQVEGNLHRTDEGIIKFLEEHQIYHGMPKSKINCEAIEELLRTGYEDIIWASVKVEGTMLVIDIQENLSTNQQAEEKKTEDGTPVDIVSDKDAVIYSILTRKGLPQVEKGAEVHKGDVLVEGRIPVINDDGEATAYQYCSSDADIMGITDYPYDDSFLLDYQDKEFTGNEATAYEMRIGKQQISIPGFTKKFSNYDTITDEYDWKLGDTFYLPGAFQRKTYKEYKIVKKRHTKEEAKQVAEKKLEQFNEKLRQKGVQIIENNVMIVTDGKKCKASGSIKVIEKIGTQKASVISEETQEGQMTDESDGEDD